MTKHRILRKDGTPSPFFWTEQDGNDRSHKTVFKDTSNGVKRKKGVHFDVEKNRLHRQ